MVEKRMALYPQFYSRIAVERILEVNCLSE
jgi:hypothetical protein